MKVTALLLAAMSAATAVNADAPTAAAGCNHDNCLRGLLGKSATLASSDCTAFLRVTVTDYTSTTSTIYTPTAAKMMMKRDSMTTISPSAYPTYAACSSTVAGQINGAKSTIAGFQRYSSACSCINALPTGTSTVQAVQTVSVEKFALGVTCLGTDSYFVMINDNGVLLAHDFNTVYPAALFNLDADGDLSYNGVKVVTTTGPDASYLYADGSAGDAISCPFLGSPTFALNPTCSSGGTKTNLSISGSGPGVWAMYLSSDTTACTMNAYVVQPGNVD
ncbi:hypothetical protein TWF694_000245 [Orbilia ellipsospora]|uniref:Secreted protein n=1 Tax=Orbilia ellipsospora TaxID=2528407 RepID=A0AAV9XND7_9PEZI